jgi:ABC-2 type transport system permease protein
MRRATAVELLKMRRSPVVLTTTLLIVILIPLICVGFLAIARGDGAGAAALKAQAMVVGEGWEAYVGLLGQMVTVAMFIGPGVVVAWAFGREFSDRTFPTLFALPVSRGSTAAAKYLVLMVWGLVLTILLLLAAVLAGVIANVGAMDLGELIAPFARLTLAGFLTATIALTIGIVASIGRGYLPAIGAIVLLTMAAQVAVLFGTGGWFPYAAPGLYAVGGANGVADVNVIQLLLVPTTTVVVVWLTVRWWDRTEVV